MIIMFFFLKKISFANAEASILAETKIQESESDPSWKTDGRWFS